MELTHLIRQVPLFSGLSETNLRSLAAACRLKKVPKKDILFLEGSKGEHIFLLEKGSIQLHKTAPDGREIIIRNVVPGDLFAEVILFEEEAYPVTAVALKESRIYLVPKKKIDVLLNHQEFRNNFIRGLLKRHRYLTNRILYLSAHDVEERFRVYLQEQYGKKAGRFPAISKKNVAAAISTSPETLSRILLKLKNKINWEKGWIEIKKGFWD